MNQTETTNTAAPTESTDFMTAVETTATAAASAPAAAASAIAAGYDSVKTLAMNATPKQLAVAAAGVAAVGAIGYATYRTIKRYRANKAK